MNKHYFNYQPWINYYPNAEDRRIINKLKTKVEPEYPMFTNKEIQMYEAINTMTAPKTYKFVRTWLVIDSDWVNSLSYDDVGAALQIKTKRGNTYVFDNVTTGMFASIMSAPSTGAAVNYNLRSQFEKVM